jgi:peptidoglycan/xylan/chitin deacetylase (PgdA/CDA1 family)
MRPRPSRRHALAAAGLGALTVFGGCGGRRAPRTLARPFFHAPGTRRIALTIDDGLDLDALAGYVALCERTGLQLSFCAVGVAQRNWDRLAPRIRALVERGQVQMVNHTYSHRPLVGMTDDQIRADLLRADDWIQASFGVSARPYVRPPDGLYDARTQAAAAGVGYTRTLLWQGSFGDASPVSAPRLMAAARGALHPGAVVLGHANAPEVTRLYPQILALIRSRNLTPVTVDQLFRS